MKIKVEIRKYGLENIRIIITVEDIEGLFSNKLFKNSLDYPSDPNFFIEKRTKFRELQKLEGGNIVIQNNTLGYFIENKDNIKDNINWIENIFLDEVKAKLWADVEIKALKDKLGI